MRASPVGQPPSARHSSSSAGPAARWIAPSTPPPPNSVVLAALTMASTAWVVMSPCTASIVAMRSPSVSGWTRSPLLFLTDPTAEQDTAGSEAMPGRELIERVREALGDRYTVIAAIGRGGNASIFGAADPTGRRVAIKVLHPELTVSVAADRFLREMRYAARLDHPHIARLLDSGESGYLLWFVMPYVEGESLREVLRRERRLAIPHAVTMACEVLGALEYAHGHGIAHRDIKPDNIVLSGAGAVLVDLGIARAIASSGDDRVTRSGFVVGTEEYMSPEPAVGSPEV